MNRLQYEHSPYLTSFAHHPVDWYPWGGEAFSLAREEQKPLLISLGHLPPTAQSGCGPAALERMTRRYFVPVQVDSREHPDITAYYTQAARLLIGRDAAPLTVLADPTGRPFYITEPLKDVELAGLLSTTALHWNSDPTAYLRTAADIHARLQPLSAPAGAAPTPETLWESHFRSLQARYDPVHGGFGTGPKQLLPQELLFLLAYGRRTGQTAPTDMALHSLRQMALGGVRDIIGGGFFRGTTDRGWRTPIPEKRLLDQAWMLEVCLGAYAADGSEFFANLARETTDFVIRELRHPAGGFYTAQWSREGFYSFTAGQVQGVLGDNDSGVFCRQYGITTRPGVPNLYSGDTPEEDTLLLHDLRMKLYRHRLERSDRPVHREDMVLTGQNGVMLAALCRAGRVLGVQRYLTAALRCSEFLEQRMVGSTDLRRYWCHGSCVGEGALEDYAGYALGLLELYESGCGGELLRRAARVMARADALFTDPEGSGYYLTRGQAQLPARPKQLWDETVPSAWSVGVMVMTRLARETRHPGIRRRAAELMELTARYAEGYPCGYGLTAMMQRDAAPDSLRTTYKSNCAAR